MTRVVKVQAILGWIVAAVILGLWCLDYFHDWRYYRAIRAELDQISVSSRSEQFDPSDFLEDLWIQDDPYPFPSFERYIEAYCLVHPVVCRELLPEVERKLLLPERKLWEDTYEKERVGR